MTRSSPDIVEALRNLGNNLVNGSGKTVEISYLDIFRAADEIESLRASQPAIPTGGEAVAAALMRRLCQLFDSGGESQRSARARHASAAFQLLNSDAPEYLAEQAKCDADPVGYLEAAESGTRNATTPTAMTQSSAGVGEPVAWRYRFNDGPWFLSQTDTNLNEQRAADFPSLEYQPLYLSAAQPAPHWEAIRDILTGQMYSPSVYCSTERIEELAKKVAATFNGGSQSPEQFRWRHKKRGTTYTEIGRANLQIATDPIEEDDRVVVYRSDADGRLWVRGEAEFQDGRFEALPMSSAHNSPPVEPAPQNIAERDPSVMPDSSGGETCKGCANTGWCHANDKCYLRGTSLTSSRDDSATPISEHPSQDHHTAHEE